MILTFTVYVEGPGVLIAINSPWYIGVLPMIPWLVILLCAVATFASLCGLMHLLIRRTNQGVPR